MVRRRSDQLCRHSRCMRSPIRLAVRHLPHGVANAILLAPCMRVVRPHAVAKFAQVWDLIPDADRTLSAEEKSHALVAWLAALVKRLPLPDNPPR